MPKDFTDDELLDKEQAAEKKRRSEIDAQRRNQELEDIKTLMASESGIRFFRRVMADGFILTPTLAQEQGTYFNEGKRNLALKYLYDIRLVCPEKLSILLMPERIVTHERSRDDNTAI